MMQRDILLSSCASILDRPITANYCNGIRLTLRIKSVDMNELSACAHALLDGVPNKVKQKEADQWIYEFKNTNAAWSICIEAIRDYSNDTTLVFVAIQILRQKVEKEWFYLTIEEQNYFEMVPDQPFA